MSVLDRILSVKRDEVATARQRISESEIEGLAASQTDPLGFKEALDRAAVPALIAEIKKASPSRGVIREDFDPSEIARTYRRAGATALSVLTDRTFFQGANENIALAKEASGLPALRKDFIIDEYQVYEARALGADAVLLIVSALARSNLEDLHALVESLGMDALVEVHNESEADTALELGATLVGINNRDLSDFATSLSVTERLAPRLRGQALVVSESALESRADIDRVVAAGARAVLIGTAFCSSPDIESKVHEVMGR